MKFKFEVTPNNWKLERDTSMTKEPQSFEQVYEEAVDTACGPEDWDNYYMAVNEKDFIDVLDDVEKHFSGSLDNLVDAPKHYNTGEIEAWDYIRDNLGDKGFVYYCEGNVKKYLHRWRYKNNPKEDLLKARAYLDRMIELTN